MVSDLLTGVHRPLDEPDADMDPWCLVPDGDKPVLFGFAHRHPLTGGLSWVLSTPVVAIDPTHGRAVTLSGRQYALGRRVAVPELPDTEARIAYALLVAVHLGIDTSVLLGDLDADLARQWIIACKMSRHLDLPVPERKRSVLKAFYARNAARYASLMRVSRRS